ncbi:hypothetical protein TeGR_g7866 [Tetraparma gracilis]|uniref:Uncharacterized protein n=1 Tax=Tetraparma gracilis TaxID=2962635 RepID=A0ABQ6MS76_9STRA|nr:hypothetical protein TeGR_g7866 [Tetraparma gracilis]
MDGQFEGAVDINAGDLPKTIPSDAYHASDGQSDFGYWTDMAQIGLRTYVPFFSANNNGDPDSRGTIASSANPGADTTSYISLEAVTERIRQLPIKQEAGTATRGNELGLLRLNTYFYPECEGEAYCGIGLGVTQADHKLVRPVLDEIFGSVDGEGDAQLDGQITLGGKRWSRTTMRQSALDFVSSRNALDMKNDAGVWTAKVLHQTALGIYLTDSEAQSFVDLQTKAVTLTALPSFAPDWFGAQLGLQDTLSKKAFYLTKYEAAVRRQIASGAIASLTGDGSAEDERGIIMAARGLLDALIFAGGLSVPGIIFSGLAAYYTGLTGSDFDINDPLQAPLLVMETIRNYPAVLGVPYLEGEHRHAPLAGMGGYDENVYPDALNFKIRTEAPDGGDGLAYYHQHSIDWADSGLPVDGAPWSARICPGKSLSYNMILAFWEAMDPTNWYVDPDSTIERENGPVWWTSYQLHRRCEIFGTHVGLQEAQRAYSSDQQGAYCNWFQWCGEDLSCNRGWGWSGSCKFAGDTKFFGESCSSNDQCVHSFTERAGVDLACRFGKCGFADGNECEDDHTIEFSDWTDLPESEVGATVGAYMTVSAGAVGLGAAGAFFLRKPKAAMKHARMPEQQNDEAATTGLAAHGAGNAQL